MKTAVSIPDPIFEAAEANSVVNVSQVVTIDKSFLSERVGSLSDDIQETVAQGLRLVLYL